MFPFWAAEYVREVYAIMTRMERRMRGECSATALCGVTDGDSEWQTELSERGEEDILVLQTPAPRHESGMSAMPCPSSLSYSNQEKHRAFDLIWRLLETSSRCLSGSTSIGNPIKTGQKEHDKHTWSQPCAVRCGGWKQQGGKIYCDHSQSCCLWAGKHHDII